MSSPSFGGILFSIEVDFRFACTFIGGLDGVHYPRDVLTAAVPGGFLYGEVLGDRETREGSGVGIDPGVGKKFGRREPQ